MEFDLGVDGAPRLSILSRLPQTGFTQALLVKRILQWRRMGLDVSELEPALNYDSNKSYELYCLIEEKVRRVVDLENYLYQNSHEIVIGFHILLSVLRLLSSFPLMQRQYILSFSMPSINLSTMNLSSSKKRCDSKLNPTILALHFNNYIVKVGI